MLTILYTPDGKAYGDQEAEAAVKRFYQESQDRPDTEITMVTSTDLVIRFALVLVHEGVIPAKDLRFGNGKALWDCPADGQYTAVVPFLWSFEEIKARHFRASAIVRRR